MRLCNKIVLASLSRDKFYEFNTLLAAYPEYKLISSTKIVSNAEHLKEAEKYGTYLENAYSKARIINCACHYPVLADDTGLEVTALGGKPGVKTNRYASPHSGMSQSQANVEKLLSELRSPDRSARFITTLVLLIDGILISAIGILEGSITHSPRGSNGFGYDPIFVPKGSQKTLAEMTDTEKNSISHRARALQDLLMQIKNKGIILAKP